jgi:hypothetical protein
MPELFKDMNESVDRYNRRAESEKWKKDHDEAMKCLELEEAIAFGLTIYNLMNRVDEICRLAVHKKKVPYNPDVEKNLTHAFREWFRGSKKLEKILGKFESLGYEVTGAEEFRAACREVGGILTEDEEFFAGDKLGELAVAAVKANASGATKELRRVTD